MTHEQVCERRRHFHMLFQAHMWREYAQAWDGKQTSSGVGREWVEKILRVSRSECLRRARAALERIHESPCRCPRDSLGVVKCEERPGPVHTFCVAERNREYAQ